MSVMAALVAVLLAGNSPLVIEKTATGPKSEVELRNAGNQPITAWSVAAVTRLPDGRTHRDIYTVDGYLGEITAGLSAASDQLDRLMPGEMRSMPIDPLPADATVEVVAVVLDDGEASGDEIVIDSIFEHRAKERDGLRAVVDVFHDVLSSQRGGAALDALHDRLSLVVQRDPSVPCRAALDAVEAYRQKVASAGPGSLPDVEQALGRYAAFVQREYELALKHAQRRRGSTR